MTPTAAPVASLGAMSMAMSPPKKHSRIPMDMPNSIIEIISRTSQCCGPNKNSTNASRLSKLNKQAGMVRLLWNNLSDRRPENTVPTMPQTELTDTRVLAGTIL